MGFFLDELKMRCCRVTKVNPWGFFLDGLKMWCCRVIKVTPYAFRIYTESSDVKVLRVLYMCFFVCNFEENFFHFPLGLSLTLSMNFQSPPINIQTQIKNTFYTHKTLRICVLDAYSSTVTPKILVSCYWSPHIAPELRFSYLKCTNLSAELFISFLVTYCAVGWFIFRVGQSEPNFHFWYFWKLTRPLFFNFKNIWNRTYFLFLVLLNSILLRVLEI